MSALDTYALALRPNTPAEVTAATRFVTRVAERDGWDAGEVLGPLGFEARP